MDFASITSSLGLGGEFSTPVGKAVETATSESLLNPDWALNMQICDEINQRGAEGSSQAAKALKRRLKSDNPKVLQLTLTLCEATVKNCSRPLHQALGTREFLGDVVTLCRGEKGYEVRSQALNLVQEWGVAFQTDRSLAFAETYGRLQTLGARFPTVEDAAPVFTPPVTAHGSGGGGEGGGGVVEPSPQTIEKLETDLQMVKDKITLCRQMLPESAGVDNDEALSEVVGFLEACRPRMVDLVEAGIGGALGEDTFAKCLQINDALLRTLEAEREGTPIAVEDSAEDSAKGAAPLIDFGASPDPLAGKMATFSIGDADDEDDFAQLRGTKTVAASAKDGRITKLGAVPLKAPESAKAAATEGAADDDLDDFLSSLDDAAPANAGGASTNLADEDLDKMLA